MAELTNLHGLPDAIVDAIRGDPYDSGRPEGVDPLYYTTTTALGSPTQQVELKRRHAHEVTEDASDRIWSLLGQSVHGILERAALTPYEKIIVAGRILKVVAKDADAYVAEPVNDALESLRGAARVATNIDPSLRNILVETRLYAPFGKWTVGGAFDHLDVRNGVLTDYKVTSVWGVRDGTAKIEWVTQAQVNTHLCRENGYEIKKAQVIAILRDWRQSEAEKDPTYPQAQVATIELPMWSREETVAWIGSRLRLIEESRALGDDALPECSDDERWAKAPKFVVRKTGNKNAVPKSARMTREEAEEFAESMRRIKPGPFEVEYRPGESKRCARYCQVMPFCSQARRLGISESVETEESE